MRWNKFKFQNEIRKYWGEFFLYMKMLKKTENWLKSIGNAMDNIVSVTKFNLKAILLACWLNQHITQMVFLSFYFIQNINEIDRVREEGRAKKTNKSVNIMTYIARVANFFSPSIWMSFFVFSSFVLFKTDYYGCVLFLSVSNYVQILTIWQPSKKNCFCFLNDITSEKKFLINTQVQAWNLTMIFIDQSCNVRIQI